MTFLSSRIFVKVLWKSGKSHLLVDLTILSLRVFFGYYAVIMTRLILLRHGQTYKNVSGMLHSRSDSSVLTLEGREQVKKASAVLKEQSADVVYCSKESRALESASVVVQTCVVPLHTVLGLEERNWGVYEGHPWSHVKAVLDKLTLEERYLYVPEGGESWKGFEERTMGAVNKILTENVNKNIVVVTHGGVIRVLMPYLLSVPKEESFKYDPDNASLTIFEYKDAKFVPIEINSTKHLS